MRLLALISGPSNQLFDFIACGARVGVGFVVVSAQVRSLPECRVYRISQTSGLGGRPLRQFKPIIPIHTPAIVLQVFPHLPVFRPITPGLTWGNGEEFPVCRAGRHNCITGAHDAPPKMAAFIRLTTLAVWASDKWLYRFTICRVLCPKVSAISARLAPFIARYDAAECLRS